MASRVKVAETSEIAPGTAKVVTVNNKKIAVFNLNGAFFAIDDACTHRGGPLSEGSIDGDSVTCPWHGATFNIKTGEADGPPAPTGVACYPVTVSGSDIQIEMP